MYWGGGSQALMLNELGEIVTALNKNFNIIGNIGIEILVLDPVLRDLQRNFQVIYTIY